MKNKITATFIFFVVLFSAVLTKSLYIQVINRDKLIAYSESQIVRKTKIYPKRGYILDREGNPLAINVQKYNLFTFVKDEVQLLKELRELKKIVPTIDTEKIAGRIKTRKKFTWIKREIELTDEQLNEVKKLKAISVESRSSRFYPNHELLSQVLGFVGIDNDGLAGIEYQFNDVLKGQPEIYKYFRDAKGRPIKFQSANLDKRAEDITLSIDKDIQSSLEDYLKEGVLKHEASSGGAAVMDVETGEIWAIANYPSFDPNHGRRGKNRKLSFITDPFEPGSVFKALTIGSAIENNIVRADTNYFCERGKFRVGNHYISESDNHHTFEWLSVAEILKHSSNIGTTKIAFDLTFPTLKKTLDKVKIGEKTGIELPGESRGILDSKENITPLRLSNISFGQGVATTGIQMLASYSAIANGGFYVRPTLLKVDDIKKVGKTRVFSKKTVSSLVDMLKLAVKEGTGKNARIKHFEIAGKTSTAQRANGSGGYTGYVSGFIGFPVNVDRKFVVFVYVDDPKKGYYGNTVAAPIFQKIVKNILYKDKNYSSMAKASTTGQTIDNISVRYSGRSRIHKGQVPNLIGLDKNSAFNILDSLMLKYDHKGFGIVETQRPGPGSAITKNTIIQLQFKAPEYD